MSLINDALKRAKQAQWENEAPPPDLPFRPAEPVTPRRAGLPLLPVAALIVAVLLGGGFIFIALQKRNSGPQVVNASQSEASPAPTQAAVTASPAKPVPDVSSQLATTTTTEAPSAGQDPSSKITADSRSTVTPDAPVAVAPEPLKTVVPKLQGIFYNPSRPSAVVNGKTVYVGSRAGEARDFLVLKISRESVTVANGSQTNVLTLEE
jgi:hypothetical protein